MGTKSLLTSKDIYQEFPGLAYYKLEYLIRSYQIKVESYGKGIPRKFPPDTIQKIKSILQDR